MPKRLKEREKLHILGSKRQAAWGIIDQILDTMHGKDGSDRRLVIAERTVVHIITCMNLI